ncbi:MAG: leucine--tRNA ligase [Nanoarchaeota archaeon]|nr:leucine--tRNA ligase [Nanoarchaeota archaeon]
MADFNKISRKWQKRWEQKKAFKVKEDFKKNKFFCLVMFPYPSSSSLHMGHARNYAIGDVYARFKRMQGFNVLYPMGYDAFGLPAENAAIKTNSYPKKFTEDAIKIFSKQQKELGLSYDWDRMITTCYPEYYKWNQWFFLKLFEKGLAYKKKAPVNWCEKCGTVLANEQVVDGKCWRCHNEVSIKQLEQWFFKITAYAEKLLKGIDQLEGWPERVKTMQQNWIGKSEGTMVNFKMKDSDEIIPIFTTRPDTLYGVTFMVYAPEHPKVIELVNGTEYERKVKDFIAKVLVQERFSRTAEEQEKEGMFIGKYAINPLTGDEIPIYIANFVLLEYGTGAIMAVPAHDQRDFEFAKKYSIPIKIVIHPTSYDLHAEKMSRAYVEDGVLVNSEKFNGRNNREAIEEITKYLKEKGLGEKTVQYKLRDWLISRQRYWGTPIPVIYCDKCGMVPVPEKDLPVKLPEDVRFTGEGNPLAKVNKFVNVKCPECKNEARRETDTMDTFVDSSWYFLRYCSPKENKKPFDPKKVKYWMPVDQYIGGVEHAVMHLLYARFFIKALKDLKLVSFDEPFTRLFNQGMLHKGGFVMSKSRGNVVTQDEIAAKYGIDTARIFLLFVASPEKDVEWSDQGVEGGYRFLNKVYRLLEKKKTAKTSKRLQNKTHKTIKDVTQYIDEFKFNLALISIMGFTDYLSSEEEITKESLEILTKLLSPFAPHLAEEMWEKLGHKNFVSSEKWPKHDDKKIDLKVEAEEEMIRQTIADIRNILELAKIGQPKKLELFVSEQWKYEAFKKIQKELETTRNIGEIIKKALVKGHEQDISRIVPRVVKDPSKMPRIITSQQEELKTLEEFRAVIEREFKTRLVVIKAEESKEHKAKLAMPGKPAILAE